MPLDDMQWSSSMSHLKKQLDAASPQQGSVVFHADDLGMNKWVDDGILQAFAHGILTSSAVLANGPTAESAVQRFRSLSDEWCDGGLINSRRRIALHDPLLPFDLGIHLNLTQGRPLSGKRFPTALLDKDGYFLPPGRLFTKLVFSFNWWRAELRAELFAQIAWLFDQGIIPTHVNGHQYIELFPGVASILPSLLAKFSINVVRLPYERQLFATTGGRGIAALPLAYIKKLLALRFAKIVGDARLKHADRFIGTAHAGRFNERSLTKCLRLVVGERLVEVALHPGSPLDPTERNKDSSGWHDALADRRPKECDLLCSDTIVDLIKELGLSLGRIRTLDEHASPKARMHADPRRLVHA